MFERLPFFAQWPVWTVRLASTAATVALSWLVARILRLVVLSWLSRLATRTAMEADDALVAEVRKRIGFWGVLVGLHLSLDYWPPVSSRGDLLAERVIVATAVVSVTAAVAAIITRVMAKEGRNAPVPVSGITLNVVRVVVGIFGLLIILSTFDIAITPMLTALGVSGLALALALQDPLSNFFTGLSVTFASAVKIGDYIRLDSGAEGYVEDFTWRTTRLRHPAGNVVEVPNNKLAQAIVTNFAQPTPEVAITVELSVVSTSDMAKVERAALDVARTVVDDVPGCVPGDSPSVRFVAFTDVGVRFGISMKVQGFADQVLVKHELIKRIHQRFVAEGIELATLKR